MLGDVILALLTATQNVAPAADVNCVRSIYHAMIGDWGANDSKFDPNNIPADAWQIFPAREIDTYVLLIAADASLWTLTPSGANTAQRTPAGLEPTARAISLTSCQTGDANRPAILETNVEVLSPTRLSVVERIEVSGERLTIVRRSQADPSQVISEEHLRRYNPAPPPGPPQPSRH